jgi:hypothetical protein
MKFIVEKLKQMFLSLAGPPKGKTSRGQLVGLYLSSTNSREDYASKGQRVRMRREGKFSQTPKRR